MTTKHTPTPWSVVDRRDMCGAFWIEVEHPTVGNVSLAEVRSGCEEAEGLGSPEANAAYIVRCVNSHDALVAALEYCLREHGGFTIRGECERMARAALTQAQP